MTVYLYYIGLIAFAVLAVYLVIKLLAAPIRGLLKLILHTLLGLGLLLVVNIIGGFFDFYIPFDWVTVLVAGVAGVPGTIALVLFKILF